MKKNARIQIPIETYRYTQLKKLAEEKGVSLSAFCRQKILSKAQLDRIEKKIDGNKEKLDKLLKKYSK